MRGSDLDIYMRCTSLGITELANRMKISKQWLYTLYQREIIEDVYVERLRKIEKELNVIDGVVDSLHRTKKEIGNG